MCVFYKVACSKLTEIKHFKPCGTEEFVPDR